ncbi:MAG TPA: GNAT family N-acetyltransferase [Chloroflexota bacterium]
MDETGGRATAIRRAAETDAPALAGLHVRSWQWAYRGMLPDAYLDGLGEQTARREAMWRQQLRDLPTDCPVWVAERAGRLVGLCNTAPARDGAPGTAELLSIYLEPDAVGTGVGAALMRHALADLRARGYRAAILWVLDANARARRFYEKGGWRPDGAAKTEDVWGAAAHEVRYRIALEDTAAP